MKKDYLFILILLLGFIGNAQIISFSGNGFKYRLTQANINNTIAKNLSGEYFKVDANNDGEIQVSEALNVSALNVHGSSAEVGNNLIGISYFTNLISLNCAYNTITTLDLSNLVNLNDLDCSRNVLTSLILNPSNHIIKLNCKHNHLSSIDTSILTSLAELNCSENQITSLSFGNLPNLTKLEANYIPLLTSPLNLSTLQNLTYLDVSYIGISTIDVSSLVNLKALAFSGNSAVSIDLSNNADLEIVDLRGNLLSDINVSNLPQLEYLNLDSNNLTTLDLSNNPLLVYLYCQNNQFTSLDLSNKHYLNDLYCAHNQITGLDLGDCTNMGIVNAGYNQLVFLNLKNGSNEYLDVQSNPNLTYICTDESDSYNYYYLYNNGYNFNSYCSFIPGGTFYMVNGSQKYDADVNGCDANDLIFPNLNYSFSNENFSGNYIADNSGNFSIPFQEGSYTVTPVLENPSYFTISPSNISVNFPQQISPYNQNFCIAPNGTHEDLEVVIIPSPARPGFDTNYIIVYKNKGTVAQSGNVTFLFNDDKMDFILSSLPFESQNGGLITWNYNDLQPFETRYITVTLNINAPSETLPVNVGDDLGFESIIYPILNDESYTDNMSEIKQVVVGSIDPNDKTCLEGDTVGSEMIGEYVHYVIRFENIGNYPAENIVVKDYIDPAKFDISTLTPTSSSHPFFTKITSGVVTEFIFKNINLPFDDASNDGYVVFKIKTKPELVVGDEFANNASIYFDYNLPITTNTATTTITALSHKDFDFENYFSLYPIPTKDILNIKTKTTVSISSISIYNVFGQLVSVEINPDNSIDISNLNTGNYIIQIDSDKGFTSSKFVKK